MQDNKSKTGQSGHKSKKEILKEILADRDPERLIQWSRKERNPLRILTSMLFEEDRLIVWRSIEAIGIVAPEIAKKDIEKIRRQIQRYFWMMNDESGALCWYGPEAIGEILANIDRFLEDFAVILSSFLVEEPFEAGSRWAMARLVTKRELPPKVMEHYRLFEPKIIESLKDPDPRIRGNALILIKALKLQIPGNIYRKLREDDESFDYYDFETGELLYPAIKTQLP